MSANSVHVLCMQETRKVKSDCFELDCGHLVYWSGSGEEGREWAGVGFVISPRFQRYVKSFTPFSNRIAGLKMTVPGGCIALFTVLAHKASPMDFETT